MRQQAKAAAADTPVPLVVAPQLAPPEATRRRSVIGPSSALIDS
jgi:hypothetical protein